MKWYVYTSKYKISNYPVKSLQVDKGCYMIRLFHYRGMFFVYRFKNDSVDDVDLFENKKDALKFCQKIYRELNLPLTRL